MLTEYDLAQQARERAGTLDGRIGLARARFARAQAARRLADEADARDSTIENRRRLRDALNEEDAAWGEYWSLRQERSFPSGVPKGA